jgi:bacteriorhodopsin
VWIELEAVEDRGRPWDATPRERCERGPSHDDVRAALAAFVALTATGATAFWMAQRRGRTSVPFLMSASLVVVVLWSRFAGPLMLTPVLICGLLLALQTTDGGLLMTSTLFESTASAHAILVLANLLFVLVVGLFATKVSATAMAANRQLQIQAWHLQQLLPARAAG